MPAKPIRFSQAERSILASKAKGIAFATLRELANAVTPETLTRWIRTQAGRKYDSSEKRGRGRPPKPQETRELLIRLAKKNLGWDYTKIQRVLMDLGHENGRTTIREVLLKMGIAPAPEGRKGKRWTEFFREKSVECRQRLGGLLNLYVP